VIEPTFIQMFLVTTGVGVLMVWLGVLVITGCALVQLFWQYVAKRMGWKYYEDEDTFL